MTVARIALAGLAVLAACGSGSNGGSTDAGYVASVGTDDAKDAACLTCHTDVAKDWAHLSSHRLLLGCTGCHAVQAGTPGKGHASVPACTSCHSQTTHQSLACTACHQQHGSANAFLFREQLALPNGGTATVHLTAPEGATPDGLAHDGKGACEVCHDSTTHYDSAGTGTPHETGWCIDCHSHTDGFAPPAPQ